MSGHSKWATIKRQKGVNDAKRGALFTKIGNQIAIAARGGTDPSLNSALAMVIEKAKAANMPMNNIQRAIDRAADKNAAQLEEIIYEGYGPGGIAVVVEAATDNKNRTFPAVKHAFSKHGGAVAEPGSVLFQFDRKGMIRASYDGDMDEALLMAIDAGAEDAVVEDGALTLVTDPKQLHATRQALSESGFVVTDEELTYQPKNMVPVDDSAKVERLLEAIDDLDDVVATHTNADF